MNPLESRACPIIRSARLIGDEWVLLVVRALFLGPQRFDDLQKLTTAATNILTNRLNRMIEAGIVTKVPYQERPVRYKYKLTPAGLGLFPMLLELWRYGDQWLLHGEPTRMRLRHLDCGQLSLPGQTCSQCGGQITIKNVKLEQVQIDVEQPGDAGVPLGPASD